MKKKFAREVAVSTVSAMVLAGITRVSERWPEVVAKFNGNGWIAGLALTGLVGVTILFWWVTWDLVKPPHKPSDFEGWARVRDNLTMVLMSVMFLAGSVGLTALTYWLVFG